MSETTETTTTSNGSGPDPAAETSPAEKRARHNLFRFSQYLHVGPGAAECEDGETGNCGDGLHFHAWCRLPNPFQHSSIREKATAAKARRIRQLRDPESDGRIILDNELEELVRQDARDLMVDEIVGKDFLKDYQAAIKELTEGEEGYTTYEEDRERFRALEAMPEDQRPAEEYAELRKTLDEFGKRIQATFDENQKPAKEALAERSLEELADLLREDRIEREAQKSFNEAYSQWEWYIGTLKPRPQEQGLPVDRFWPDINQMLAAAPEVIEALDSVFTDMDAEAGRALKNS